MTASPAAAGELGFLAAPALLRDVALRRASGQLELRRGGTVQKVFCRSGIVVYATSSDPAARLGDVLLAHGKITRAQYEESARQIAATGRKLGTVLVGLGALTPRELFRGLIAQVREIVLSPFAWDDGQWSFLEGRPAQERIVSLRLHPAELIFEGVRRATDDPRFAALRPAEGLEAAAVESPPRAPAELALPPDAERLLASLAPGLAWPETAARAGLCAREAAGLLWGLVLLGLVETRPRGGSAAAAPPEPPAVPLRIEAWEGGRHGEETPAADDGVTRLGAAVREADPGRESRIAREQFRRAMAQLKEGDFWSAAQSLRWAVNLSPHNATYHTYLGVALTRTRKRLHEAEEHCRKAISLDYGNALHYVHLGHLYRTGHLFEKARAQFEHALKLEPRNAQALLGLGELRHDEATARRRGR